MPGARLKLPAASRHLLHQSLVGRADDRRVPGPRYPPHLVDDPHQTLPRGLVRHGVRQLERGRPLARAELEGERVVEPDLAHQRERLLELVVGLAGEADDDVRRDGEVGDGGPQALDDLEILLAGVASQHPLEHPRASALRRQVYVLAHGPDLRHGRDDAVREVVGVWAGEPHAANPVHGAGRAEQVREVVLAVVIRVDRLAKERHLRHAVRNEALRLAHDVGQSTAPLRSPRVRNYAERAPIIAAALDGDERAGRRPALRDHVLVVLGGDERRLGGPLPFPGAADELRQLAIPVRPHHEVHVRGSGEQPFPEPLRHAPHHAEDVTRPLVALQLAHPPEHALLGVIADGAGVHDHDFGLSRRLRARITFAHQDPGHKLGVSHVHLAAVGLDEEARCDHAASALKEFPLCTRRPVTRPRPSAQGASAGICTVR